MSSDIERRQNAEANRFAIALLMPAELVETEFDRLNAADKNMRGTTLVKAMARKFIVSETMMTARLVELGLMMAP